MLWEHEPHIFQVLPNFHECFYNWIETWSRCFLFLSENTIKGKGKQLVNFHYKNVNSLCLRHHYVNSSCKLCISIKLQKHNFQPISVYIFSGLFSKLTWRVIILQTPKNVQKISSVLECTHCKFPGLLLYFKTVIIFLKAKGFSL